MAEIDGIRGLGEGGIRDLGDGTTIDTGTDIIG
jgi:hypothetical protein